MVKVKVKFINGLSFHDSIPEILGDLVNEFEFVDEPEHPDVVIFGPYGNEKPNKDCIKVGYYCENFLPNLDICDYAFGVPYEEEIKHPNYRRIDFHGFQPARLIKESNYAEKAISQHTHFCNFLYRNPVSYRESFFDELSKYKIPDSPGVSRNNMPSLASDKILNRYDSKLPFIKKYKFTIAFENYTYPGYHTEKILEPMEAGSIPIYIGNPEIAKHFNVKSIIHGRDFILNTQDPVTLFLQKIAQPDYNDWRPSIFNSPYDRVRRKIKKIGRQTKLSWEFRHGFEALIEEIIRLDKDDDAYYSKLSEPWLINNQIPDRSRFLNQWRTIFNRAAQIPD
jgi:hypothetical protein